MKPVDLSAQAADPEPRHIVIAKDQPQYEPLPALVFGDGKVCTEWALTEDERKRLIAGERVRLWIWAHPQVCSVCQTVHPPKLQPVALSITNGD